MGELYVPLPSFDKMVQVYLTLNPEPYNIPSTDRLRNFSEFSRNEGITTICRASPYVELRIPPPSKPG